MDQDNASNGLRGLRATDSSELIAAVCNAYGFNNIEGITDLSGSSNLNLLVENQGFRYVVRIYRPYVTKARLDDIQHIRERLTANGVPCAVNLLTQNKKPWIEFENRLIEVEHYIDNDSCMDSWERLETALPMLGRIHSILQDLEISQDGKRPLFANHLPLKNLLEQTVAGTQRIRSWAPSPLHSQLADKTEELADRVNALKDSYFTTLPKQIAHGDFWDTNVRFKNDEIALIADFDFMGERLRICDPALTLYFTSMKYKMNPDSEVNIQKLKRLVDAYDSGLMNPLSEAERAALPSMIAAQPLWSMGGWVALLDDETVAQEHAAGMLGALNWALEILENLDRWQSAFEQL